MWGSSPCFIIFFVALMACHPTEIHTSQKVKPASLQAISVIKKDPSNDQTELIALTDVAFKNGQWGEGRILVIDPQKRTLVRVYYPQQANPLDLLAVEGGFLSLQAGILTLAEVPYASHGSVSWYPLDDLQHQQEYIWLSAPLTEGYPVSFQANTWRMPQANDFPISLLMSSGVSGVVWDIDLPQMNVAQEVLTPYQTKQIRYAPEGQLSLGVLALWQDQPLVVDFNSDQLMLLKDDQSLAECRLTLGRFPQVMEGAQTPFVDQDHLWVSFGLSGELIEINLREIDWNDPNCEVVQHRYDPPLGAVPNDLIVSDDYVYVLHSGEQDVWVFQRQSKSLLQRWKLPNESHPWHMTKVLLPEGERLFISTWLSGELLSLNMQNGQVEHFMTSEQLRAPEPALCVRPTMFDTQGLTLNESWTTLSWPSSFASQSTSVESEFLIDAPQLSLSIGKGKGKVAIEFQIDQDDVWYPLTEFSVVQQEDLQSTNDSSVLLQARHVLIVDLAAQQSADDPCSTFIPQAHILRLPLPQIGISNHGQRALTRVRLRQISGIYPIVLMDVVYRSW